jgi:hypothetical protein
MNKTGMVKEEDFNAIIEKSKGLFSPTWKQVGVPEGELE